MKTCGLWAALASVARRSRDTPYYERQCQGGEGVARGEGGPNENDHLAASPSGWTIFSQGRSRVVAVIDCDVPFTTSPLNADRIGTWVVRFIKWSSQQSRFNQKGTSGTKSDTCQWFESRTTPTSGHTVIGVNLARNVPYDYSSALRKHPVNYTALTENSLRLQSRLLTYFPAPAIWSIR
jgi:hypothetical protein